MKSHKINIDYGWFDKLTAVFRYNIIKNWIRKGDVVLDLGCGDGYMLSKFRNLIRNSYGIDARVTRSYDFKTYKIIQSIIKDKIDFRNNTFNKIICAAFIEHIRDPKAIISECYRILNPNGLLIITTPSKSADKIIGFFSKLGGCYEAFNHEQYFTLEKLQRLLEKQGFEIKYKRTFQLGLNQLIIARKI